MRLCVFVCVCVCLCVFVLCGCGVCVLCVCVLLCVVVCSDMLDSRMQRLRLEQEARSKNFEARVADEALSQFNECQRLLNEVELAASKRKIQELEVAAAQPDPKKLKHHIPGKLDRSLESFFGFNSGGRKPSEHMFFCSAHGCDRGFPTVRARGAHMLVHKNSRQRFTYNFCNRTSYRAARSSRSSPHPPRNRLRARKRFPHQRCSLCVCFC